MLKLLQTLVHIEISGHHSSGFNLFVNKKHFRTDRTDLAQRKKQVEFERVWWLGLRYT